MAAAMAVVFGPREGVGTGDLDPPRPGLVRRAPDGPGPERVARPPASAVPGSAARAALSSSPPATTAPATTATGAVAGPGTVDRLFAADSPVNTPIPAAAVVDAAGDRFGRYLAAHGPAIADLYEYGVPVFDADASTPRVEVICTKSWGTCGLSRQPVPIPHAAAPSSGSDGAMVVIDRSTRTSYEFWQARRSNGTWVASWGGTAGIDGPGTPGSAVGAGVSRLAGVVRTEEIARSRIDHALVFSTANACPTHRYPASKSDGGSTRPDCVPQGARIQLDPSLDVESLPGITPGERAVARAMQIYGAYAVDSAGAAMAVIFEDPAGKPDPYPAAGFGRDYDPMVHIPWERVRVLRQWDGR
ncbi:MAG TPA: hypothetical protein VHM89_00725 [Acidimicrobiales bacterium]|nr:hypothetical protein [Acidimicrobiales bacterium]